MTSDREKLGADIVEVADEIAILIDGVPDDMFGSNRNFRHLIERKLEIIGEATRHLDAFDPEFVDQVPSLRKMIGLRSHRASVRKY